MTAVAGAAGSIRVAVVPGLQTIFAMPRVSVYLEIQQFIALHRICGKVTGSVQSPSAEGYTVSVSCACGEELSRWVTPEAARYDMIFSTLLCCPN